MPKDSCIDHQRRGDLIVLRRHMVDLFGGDHCAAVVLAYFEYATNGELDRFERSGDVGEPWVTATMPSIYQETTGLFSIRTLQTRIDWLQSIGFLTVDQQNGKANRYLLNIDLVNECIDRRRVLAFSTPAKLPGSDEAQTPAKLPGTPAAPSAKLPGSEGCIKSVGSIKKIEEEKDPPTPLPGNSTSPQPGRLDLEDDILTFVANAYRRENRRAKLDNLRARSAEPTCEKIRRAESEHGAETFRAALLAYLASDNERVSKERWPIRWFLAHIDWYFSSDTSKGMASTRPAAVNGTNGKANGFRPAEFPPPPLPINFPARWNELVPERPVDTDVVTESFPAYQDAVFTKRFDEICGKFRSLIQRGASLTYLDLFRRDSQTGVPWWKRGLMDGLEWMVAPSGNGKGKSKGATAMDEYLNSLNSGKETRL